MSELERTFAKAKLASFPPPEPAPGHIENEESDDVGELGRTSLSSADSSSSASSAGTIKPLPGQRLFERPSGAGSRSKGGPLPWQDFFAQELWLDNDRDGLAIKHHIYLTPPSTTGPLFVTHHGAGSSGLSFAPFAKELQKLLPNAGILSIDARHHGETTMQRIQGDAPIKMDLSLDSLSSDFAFVVGTATRQMNLLEPPGIVLIGHSLGGAVVTQVAHEGLLGPSLLGYGVLDVVEGSAIDALQSMDSYLSTRPKSFPSLVSGIDWHVRSRTIRNTLSARISVPPLLQATQESTWTWRTDLQATKPFWEGWFQGLSRKFLESRGGKLLILAGTDRLDKELMIGQMQGKYQLQVFPEAGHFVHEDQPEKTAMIAADFFRRNDRSALVLPPKVDDLIKQGKIRPASS